MAFSDYGALIKKNGVYMTEQEIDELYKKTLYSGHAACGTEDFYVEAYKCNLKVIYKNKQIFSRYDNYSYEQEKIDQKTKIINTIDIPKELNDGIIKYQWYNENCLLCSYEHPITKDYYEMLFGYAVGYNVYNWWINALGVDKEEALKECILKF